MYKINLTAHQLRIFKRQLCNNFGLDGIMLRFGFQILLYIILAALTPAQTTFYISSSQGDDNNSGTSAGSPWKSIAKINKQRFNPGDRILFLRGDSWNEKTPLEVFYYSGTEYNRITFGAYGTGNKPIISLISELDDWKDASRWNQYSYNIWYMTLPSYDINGVEAINRLWLDGVEYPRAKDLYDSNLDNLSNEPETFGVNSKHRYFHSVVNSEDILYVYTDGSNPAYYYSSIKYSGCYKPVSGTISYTIELRDADYITFEDLDVRGGMYSSFLLNGSDYIIIDNCDISKAQHGGINGDGQLAGDKTSDYVEIKNCNIDSYRQVKVNFYDGSVEYAITAGSGTSNWAIHDNYFKNWSFAFLTTANYGNSYSHKFYDNEVTAPDIEYAKPVQLGAMENSYNNQFHEIYRNYFHDMPIGVQLGNTGSGLCGDFKIYFNIFENLTYSQNEHTDQLNSGWGLSMSKVQRVYVFNNTFYNLNLMALLSWTWDEQHYYYNNLIVNSGFYNNGVGIQDAGNSSYYYNNLIYFPGKTASDNLVSIISRGGYLTINGLNNQDYASNNIQHLGSLQSLMNTNNFTLSYGSPAISAGKDISSLIPYGFTDRYGVVVNPSKPDIGAIQYSVGDNIPPSLISAVLLNETKLILTFSEALSSAGVASAANYSISNGVTVSSAEFGSNSGIVILTTSPHTYGQNYVIDVYNLRDVSGNSISFPNNTASYLGIFNTPPDGTTNKLSVFRVSATNLDENPNRTIDGMYLSNGGDDGSRWKASPMPQSLVYDLGTIKTISKTRVSFYDFQNGRVYTYNILVSNDSLNWAQVINNASSSYYEWTTDTFDPIAARYVKLDILSNNQNDWATVWEVEIYSPNSAQSNLLFNGKVYLQGAYENLLMRTTLSKSKLLPLKQPYTSEPWNYNGNESVASVPSDAVDWLLLELRTDVSKTTVVSQRAAFLLSNGNIVDIDGVSPVSFHDAAPGDYFVVIHHRNHLNIMSSVKLTLSESLSTYDFSSSPVSCFGGDLANLGNGIYGMYSGDGDRNGVVNVLDYGTVGNFLFKTGYYYGDLDLNGIVNVLDYGKTNQNLLKITNVP